MFTSDPKFKKWESETALRLEKRLHREKIMELFGVRSDQVVFIDENRHYTPESPAVLQACRAVWKVPRGATIFSDCGNSFFDHKSPVIPAIFGVRTAQYPPSVHYFLSPNDNHCHGSAKAKWRQQSSENGWGKDDSVESSLCLLGCLSDIPQEEVQSYFRNNFMIGKSFVSPSRCKELIGFSAVRKIEQSEKYTAALRKYESFSRHSSGDDELHPEDIPPELNSSLDGSYWN
jgi:hypothetical protein